MKASSVLRYGLAGLTVGSALAAMAALRSLLNPTAFTLFLAAVTVTGRIFLLDTPQFTRQVPPFLAIFGK